MKTLFSVKVIFVSFSLFIITFLPKITSAQSGRIAQKVNSFKQRGSFTKESSLFSVATNTTAGTDLSKILKSYTLLDIISPAELLKTSPSFLNFTIPLQNNRSPVRILLYKESISPNGFSLRASDGKSYIAPNMIHYKGTIEGDLNAVVSFSFSENEAMGLISNANGNYVLGKLNDHSGKHIIYNDHDLIEPPVFDCSTNTAIPQSRSANYRNAASATSLTTKCVNWYWETDYDLFIAKQSSVANVTSYMQGIFNQVQTLYANDGISITLKTLFVWNTTDPYTGPSTSNYLDQFGVSRTTIDGDLATLIGTQGGGGVAWISGLCNNQTKYKMGYCGINTSYANVPSYSWTVEVITHEQGHLLGSRHTHDCVWNGNNTKIDGCGDNAGYSSGTCAVPANPTGGGTIMSYCHLTSVGINFNLGFGPQPTALIVNNVNNANCLINCTTGCTTPGQPAAITGNTSVCAASSQTYSVAAVAGATSYIWTLPAGWTGSSTTNSITTTVGSTPGNITVTATNTCGPGTARTMAVTVTTAPAMPGTITGNVAVCAGTSQAYSVLAVSGATSYTWTLPSGWSGTSTTNSINTTSGIAGGTISVKANNGCGSGALRTLTVSITASTPAQPGSISGAVIVCPGVTQSYSISSVSGASTYNWVLPAGWSGTSTTNSITVTTGNTGGDISVTATNGCGTSTARAMSVTTGGTTPGAPGAITVGGGTATVCTGDIRTYTVTAIPGLTYNWVAPSGSTITNGQGTNSISLTFTSNFVSPGTLSVAASNACGSGSSSSISISKNTIARPGTIAVSGGSTKVCNGDTRTYTVAAVSGITYNWTAPLGGNIISGQGSSSITINYTANFISNGTLSVIANNNCGSSVARTLTIARNLPASPAAITGPATICNNTVGTYTASAVSGATGYSWTIPSSGTVQGPANGNSISILWGTSGGNLSVRATNLCGSSGSRSLKIITNACLPGLASISGNENSTTVFPNPTNDIASVRYHSIENTLFTFTVSDILGRSLFTEKQMATTGINVIQLRFGSLKKGIYFILVESRNSKKFLKINIQ